MRTCLGGNLQPFAFQVEQQLAYTQHAGPVPPPPLPQAPPPGKKAVTVSHILTFCGDDSLMLLTFTIWSRVSGERCSRL